MTISKESPRPLVSIVIPTYNRCGDLKRCLDSLLSQTLDDFEITVIDNGSTDGTPDLLKKYPIKVIRDSKKNLPYLFNIGWRTASADIVAYINDDAEAVPDWLENILKTFDEFKDAEFVGGPTISTRKQEILATYEMSQRSMLRVFAHVYNVVVHEGRLLDIGVLSYESGAYSIGASLHMSTKLGHSFYVDNLSLTGMAVKKKLFYGIGGFDENFQFSQLDGDLIIRARKAGYRLVFNPKAIVYHHISPVGSTRVPFYLGRDFGYFYMKNIRPKSVSGCLRFALNIFFLNSYWLYRAFQLRSVKPLKGVLAFIFGVIEYLNKSAYKHPPKSKRN